MSQKAAIALDILPMLEEEAKERQRLAGEKNLENYNNNLVAAEPQQLVGEEPKGRAAEQAAALVGASSRNVYRVKKIAVSFRYTDSYAP